jgi:hypothetical protein
MLFVRHRVFQHRTKSSECGRSGDLVVSYRCPISEKMGGAELTTKVPPTRWRSLKELTTALPPTITLKQ